VSAENAVLLVRWLIGCSRTVELLAAECGCPLEHPTAVKFRSYVMDGDWDQVSRLRHHC